MTRFSNENRKNSAIASQHRRRANPDRAFEVPAAVDTSAWIKWAGVFSVGADRAVMATVAPPCKNRSAIALPAPLVPPVTRTRFPENSLVLVAFVARGQSGTLRVGFTENASWHGVVPD